MCVVVVFFIQNAHSTLFCSFDDKTRLKKNALVEKKYSHRHKYIEFLFFCPVAKSS